MPFHQTHHTHAVSSDLSTTHAASSGSSSTHTTFSSTHAASSDSPSTHTAPSDSSSTHTASSDPSTTHVTLLVYQPINNWSMSINFNSYPSSTTHVASSEPSTTHTASSDVIGEQFLIQISDGSDEIVNSIDTSCSINNHQHHLISNCRSYCNSWG
ncbi:hypothetical protein ACTA71_007964 [Dictyostelium dimigraforme]